MLDSRETNHGVVLCPFKYLWQRVSVLAILSYVMGESFVVTATLVKTGWWLSGGTPSPHPWSPCLGHVFFELLWQQQRKGRVDQQHQPGRYLWSSEQLQRFWEFQGMGLWQGHLCKGLTHSVNVGGNANRLTFGKGTQLIIQPCKCFCSGHRDLNAVPMGTFPNPAPEPLLALPSMAPSDTQRGFWAV